MYKIKKQKKYEEGRKKKANHGVERNKQITGAKEREGKRIYPFKKIQTKFMIKEHKSNFIVLDRGHKRERHNFSLGPRIKKEPAEILELGRTTTTHTIERTNHEFSRQLTRKLNKYISCTKRKQEEEEKGGGGEKKRKKKKMTNKTRTKRK